MSTLVFVPVSLADLETMATGVALAGPLTAYSTTPGLHEALEYASDADEEAERAALLFASVAALLAHGRRLVAVAGVPAAAESTEHDDVGEVTIPALEWSQVTAIFADEPGAVAAVERAAGAASELRLDDAWQLPEVAALVEEHDLLWYAPEELASIRADGNPAT